MLIESNQDDIMKLQKSFKTVNGWYQSEITNEDLNFLKANFKNSLIDQLSLAIAVAGRVLSRELTA
jgi:hypothetical protein